MRRVLVDTHVVLWALRDSPRLGATARSVLTDVRTTLLWSAVVTAELAMLARLGRLRFHDPLPTVIGRALEEWGFDLLPIAHEHALALEELPLHHRDPFDRLLLAQGRVEDVAIVSADTRFDEYGMRRIGA